MEIKQQLLFSKVEVNSMCRSPTDKIIEIIGSKENLQKHHKLERLLSQQLIEISFKPGLENQF